MGGFHILASVNDAAMNIVVQIFIGDPAFNFCEYLPRSGITRFYGNSVFSFLRGYHSVFYSGCIIFHFHQKCTKFPISPHPRQSLLDFYFFS